MAAQYVPPGNYRGYVSQAFGYKGANDQYPTCSANELRYSDHSLVASANYLDWGERTSYQGLGGAYGAEKMMIR